MLTGNESEALRRLVGALDQHLENFALLTKTVAAVTRTTEASLQALERRVEALEQARN